MDTDADGTWDDSEMRIGTYDLQDRLVTYGTSTYTYTDGGMLASKIDGSAVTEYDYDLMGNLKGVDLPDGRTIDYMVDGLGRRIWKKENGVLVKGYIYADALNPIAELNGDDETESVFHIALRALHPDSDARKGAQIFVHDPRFKTRHLLVREEKKSTEAWAR